MQLITAAATTTGELQISIRHMEPDVEASC